MIVSIETVKLHRALSTIVRFASKDADSMLCTVRIEGAAGSAELTLIATNGHMCATYRLELSESLEEDVGSTFVAPSVTAAIAAIAPYAKAAEADRKQCSLFAAGGGTTFDFDEGCIAVAAEGDTQGLRVPLQAPPGQMSFPPWRQLFVRPAGAVQTIGLNAAYVKEIAAAFAACLPTAGLYWQFGATGEDATLVRSADVEELQVLLMPIRPEATEESDPRQTSVAGSELAQAVAEFRTSMAESVGVGGTVSISANGGEPVVIAGKAKRKRGKAA